jgi:hypothetical protein
MRGTCLGHSKRSGEIPTAHHRVRYTEAGIDICQLTGISSNPTDPNASGTIGNAETAARC